MDRKLLRQWYIVGFGFMAVMILHHFYRISKILSYDFVLSARPVLIIEFVLAVFIILYIFFYLWRETRDRHKQVFEDMKLKFILSLDFVLLFLSLVYDYI